MPEEPLATVCQTTKYNIIHIKGILSYATVNPGIDFNNHCSFPLNAFRNWPSVSKNGLSLLDCAASVGKDIATYQTLGKKIVLVIDPLEYMSTNTSALPNGADIVAKNIWDLFLGGTSPYRPFGQNVVVDGLDIHIWNNNNNGTLDLAKNLKTLMGSNYIFAVSFDMVNKPCTNDGATVKPQRLYSDFLYQQLTLPADQRGPLTSDAYMCRNVTVSLHPSPSPSPSPSPTENGGNNNTGGGGVATTTTTSGNNGAIQLGGTTNIHAARTATSAPGKQPTGGSVGGNSIAFIAFFVGLWMV
ncbi:UNVERIFIED_CONTAM: Chitinase 1 [Siphonaria sp. JEL0065]|nr:Chitinase 1 [Siphonaria sp. JEL0065]